MMTKWFLLFVLLIPSFSFAETTDLVCDFPNKVSIDLLMQTDGALCKATNFYSTLNSFKQQSSKSGISGKSIIETSEVFVAPVCADNETDRNENQISRLQIHLAVGGSILLTFENGLDGAVKLVNNSNLKALKSFKQVLGKCEKRGLPGMPGVSGGN